MPPPGPPPKSAEGELLAGPKELPGRHAMAQDGAAAQAGRSRFAVASGGGPAEDEAGVEGVARTGRVGRGDCLRGHLNPKHRRSLTIKNRGPSRAALENRDRGNVEERLVTVGERSGLRSGREQEVGLRAAD